MSSRGSLTRIEYTQTNKKERFYRTGNQREVLSMHHTKARMNQFLFWNLPLLGWG
jgi:hypothetical protein